MSALTLRWVSFACLWCISLPVHAKFDDTLFLKNGDRLSGEIKELHRDILRYKTDAMGTVHIRWEDIQSLQTEQFLRIELKSGRRLIGSLSAADAAEHVTIATRSTTELHHRDDLVAFVPLKLQQGWIDRLDGSIKFGLNGTKASNIRWNLGVDTLYRGEDWEVSSRWDSIITTRSEEDSSERIAFTTNYRNVLANRWFWNALIGYDKNDELGIDDRWSLGGGGGRFLVRSNAIELMLQTGLLASREFRIDAINDQLEAYLGMSFAWFQHHFPKTDIRTDVTLLPSLTDSGRLRTNWDVSVAREIIGDLKLDLSVYYSTDNKSPEEAAANDWGIVTSLEYSF